MPHHYKITHFAQTTWACDRRVFFILRRDCRSHMYIIGKTGTRKSTLLATLIRQDIQNGEGLALLDPHGDIVEQLVTSIPEHRRRDLIYFNVPDRACTLSFNPLEGIPPEKRPLVASGILEVFQKIWTGNSWGVRLE